MIKYQAKGMGAAEEGILSLLKDKYKKEMTLKEGEKLAMEILKEVMQETLTVDNCELTVIPVATKKVTTQSSEYIKAIIDTL